MGIILSLLTAPFNVPECIITGLNVGYPFGTALVECFLSLGSVDDVVSGGGRRLTIRGADDIDWSAFRKMDGDDVTSS